MQKVQTRDELIVFTAIVFTFIRYIVPFSLVGLLYCCVLPNDVTRCTSVKYPVHIDVMMYRR